MQKYVIDFSKIGGTTLVENLVSVIMGVYNVGQLKTVDNMMNSILNQTYKQIEFIICDDGSADNTFELMQEYAKRDDRIKLIKNECNKGLAFSLNECIKVSSGEFIARQDADDVSTLDRLEKQVDFLNTHSDIAFVGTNVLLCDDGVWGQRELKEFPKKNDFLFCSPFVHGTIMFRKSSLDAVNCYKASKETYRVEDYDLFMRMYEQGLYGANIQEFLYNYQENKNNMSKRKYKYRVDEMKIRYDGFKRLGLLPKGFIYVIKPLVVGIIPQNLLMSLKLKFKIFTSTH